MAIVAVAVAFLCLPGRADAASGVPLIVDTDIYSNADDVSALASAFALQQRGEAQVLAVTVNNPTYRSAVATDSWKCVAAITNFYGFPNIPIGAEMPDAGPADTSPYVKPCAQLAPVSAQAPTSAVDVLRQALASQPGSASQPGNVVMVEIGYEHNLEDLLQSAPDAISSLSGVALVAAKVKQLIVMGGSYPNSVGVPETNFAGDPPAAQYVAAHWPTKVVWSGTEVGSAVRTGYSVPCVHPPNSPLLVSLDAFAGPQYRACSQGPNIPSYDPTTLYDAVLPDAALLTENGPGTNVVDQGGNNTFTAGAGGDQYYLSLSGPSAASMLAGKIESLLDTLPPTGSISGTVDDASTGQPIAAVTVQAHDVLGNLAAQTTTGADGTYTLSGIYGGSYTLAFVAPAGSGYQSYTDNGASLAGGENKSGVNVALGAPPSSSAIPTITGIAQVGQTLSEAHGSWTRSPTGYAYQWEDCSGVICAAIAGATFQSYKLTASDLGHAIRVQEYATNAFGTSAAATSNATASVQQSPTTTTTTTTSTPTKHLTISSGRIRALLRSVLAAHGSRARIRALLRNGGYRFAFSAPVPGRLRIAWYRESTHGMKLLVARVALGFHKSLSARVKLVLTGRGRTLLKGRRAIKLTASGSFAPAGGVTVSATKSLRLRP